jgi:hypothetical protein
LLSPISAAVGAVIYVDADSPGGDGSRWEEAFRFLQDALVAAAANDEIRVAQGTYVPDQNSLNPDGSGDRRATFQLISGVGIYGGYAGYGEPDPDARDIRKYETILSGDLRGNDFPEAVPAEYATERARAENSYHVVTSSGVEDTTVLDGFTIAAGQADGGGEYGRGGGMYNAWGNPTLINCTFTRNWANVFGGAIEHPSGSYLVVIKCRFIGNAAGSHGGAVSTFTSGSGEFINCSFTGNVSLSGSGGAIDIYSKTTLINCTLCGNSAEGGGGISVAYSIATLTNCIFWDNSDDGGTDQSAQISDVGSAIDVSFCCVQGWNGSLGGLGNTGEVPLLADTDGADNRFGTIDDNPRLLPGSACLNAGDNDSVPTSLGSDLDGDPRIVDGTVDLGAYEGVTQAILLTTQLLTVPEGDTNSFGVSLALAPDANVEVSVSFEWGDADIALLPERVLTFGSANYSTPRMVSVTAAEDPDYLHGTALILVQGGSLRPVGVTVKEQDNEPTTGIVYVDDDATGSRDGMSWDGAYSSLQDALRAAVWNPQVWEIRVAEGIYRPDEGVRMVPNDRDAAFHLENGVRIIGGYAGLSAADPDVRNAALYETILSGDLAGDDRGFINNEENSYHVVCSEDTNETAVLDGFTVTAGNADGLGSYRYSGGGIHCLWAGSIVANCTVTRNCSAQRGGGMYNHEGSGHVRNCVFSNNVSDTDGGGIYNHHGYPAFSNCIISDNFAAVKGGGIANDCLHIWLTNCIIVANEAGEYGGGWFDYDASELDMANCILWDNIAYEGPQMAITGSVDAFIRNCCFQGGRLDIFTERSRVHWGDGNLDEDPRFADASGGDYHLKSRAGRWEPDERRWTMDEFTSPCIDAGDPNSDWTAELWPHGKRINMGVFGGTPEASMSESSVGNRADLNNNHSVGFRDFAALAYMWQAEGPLRAVDLNRDAIVDFLDVAEFVKEWLWREL